MGSAFRFRRSLGVLAVLWVAFASGTSTLLATQWPLPLAHDVVVDDLGDFHGALYRFGNEALQIDAIVWKISTQGDLRLKSLSGFRADGSSFNLVFPTGADRIVQSIADFHDFVLEFGIDAMQVQDAIWGIDEYGYLTILHATGTYRSDGSPFSMTKDGEATCGLHVTQSCIDRNCRDQYPCGSAPTCSCSSGGGCDPTTYTYCDGTCSTDRICNQDTKSCGCMAGPLPPPPGGGGGGKGEELSWCPPNMPPTADGSCFPSTCYLCLY
jgi:hypothetical protein